MLEAKFIRMLVSQQVLETYRTDVQKLYEQIGTQFAFIIKEFNK